MRPTLSVIAFLLLMPVTAVAGDKKAEALAREKAAEKRFARLKEYCKERRITHVVELLAEWGEFAGRDQQEVLVTMAAGLVKDARAEAEELGENRGIPGYAQIEFRGASPSTDVKYFKTNSAYFVNECDLRIPFGKPGGGDNTLKGHVVVAAKSFLAERNSNADDCVILTNAPTAELLGAAHSVIVASGDLAAFDTFDHSTVVCRGEVEYRMKEKESSLIKAGGQLVHSRTRQTNGKSPQPNPDPRRAFPNDKDLLGVKFYSAAEDGLEATADRKKESVTVAKLDERKAFAKAGVKTGDEIEAINGERVRTLHELDRLLCRATVSSGLAKIKLLRGKETVEVEVKLTDW